MPFIRNGAFRVARKSHTFAATAGNGAVGTIDLFTCTGRVWVQTFAAYCTSNITDTGGTATLIVGHASDDNEFVETSGAIVGWDTGEFLIGSGAYVPDGSQTSTQESDVVLESDIIATVAGEDITGGAAEFYVLYVPLSAGASLVPA